MWKTAPSFPDPPFRHRVLIVLPRVNIVGKGPSSSTAIHDVAARGSIPLFLQRALNNAFPALRKTHPESSSWRLRTRFRNSASLAISASTLFTEWMTVEWSRSPKSSPIFV